MNNALIIINYTYITLKLCLLFDQLQGVGGFYRGIDANIMRAMVLNGTKMSCYDQIKGMIVKSGYVPSGEW